MDSEVVATTTHDCGITRKQLGDVARELSEKHGPIEICDQSFAIVDGAALTQIRWRRAYA
jgi:hypothetical protein